MVGIRAHAWVVRSGILVRRLPATPAHEGL
jgi:hypothetical protein